MPVRSQYSAILPDLSPERRNSMKASIADIGVVNPVWLLENGEVLDGWNRVQICEELDLPYPTKTYHGKTPWAFVTASTEGREVSQSMRAALYLLLEKERNQQEETPPPAPVPGVRVPGVKNAAERAQEAGTAERTLRDAETVMNADPETFGAVARGEISAKKAAAKVREKAAGEVATPPPAPVPGVVKALKLTPEQRLKKQIATLEGELLEEKTAHGETREDRATMATMVVEMREEIIALQAVRDNEHVLLIQKLQAQVRAVEADRDTVNRQRDVMVVELKRLQRVEDRYKKLAKKK